MQDAQPVTVVLAHFDDLLALGLKALIERDPSVTLLACDVDPSRISTVLQGHHPQVAILSATALRHPSQVRELRMAHPQTHIVLLADRCSSADCAQMLAFGASACLCRATQSRDVLNAIHLASRGLQVLPHTEQTADAGVTIESDLLTMREAEVLGLLRERRQNAQIAAELHISVETVRTHARNIYRKLGVSSRRELTAPARPALRPVASAAVTVWPGRGHSHSARQRGHR
jgi:DNA-binding NarL/FixJ family response regulator